MTLAQVTGQNIFDFLTTTLLGFELDETYFLTLLNIARSNRELSRPWKVLQTIDKSQTCTPSDTFQSAKSLPEGFVRLSKEGIIWLYNASANKWERYTEIPADRQLEYKDSSGKFFIDHYTQQFFLCGSPADSYTIWIPCQLDPGDITLTTRWLKFPDRFAYILAYDIAAMHRLGADYDDINARMGDQNAVQAEIIARAMAKWDNELALSSVTQMDYPALEGSNNFSNGHINRDY